jgi:hypothetical protein
MQVNHIRAEDDHDMGNLETVCPHVTTSCI